MYRTTVAILAASAMVIVGCENKVSRVGPNQFPQ